MTYYGGKDFYLNRIELYLYPFTVNVIPYEQMLLASVVQEDTFYLDILLYKSYVRIYLPATKSVLQAE